MKKNLINNTNQYVQNTQIKIPCGSFCANNCTDCVYANWNDKDKDGWIKCNNSNIRATYVDPSDRYGCWHYKYERS